LICEAVRHTAQLAPLSPIAFAAELFSLSDIKEPHFKYEGAPLEQKSALDKGQRAEIRPALRVDTLRRHSLCFVSALRPGDNLKIP
jgi:hypothetical protein